MYAKIEWENKKQVKKWFREEPEKFIKTTKRALNKAVFHLDGNVRKSIKSKKLIDRGTMWKSTNSYVKGFKAVEEVRVKYAKAQEFGTRPFRPPKKALMQWGLRKFGSEAIGLAVAKKIARVGIKPKHFFQEAIDKSGKKMIRLIEEEFFKHFNRKM